MTNLEKSRLRRASKHPPLLQAKIDEDREFVAAVEARKGELPQRDLLELRELKAQIDAARAEKQTAKETLIATRDTEQVAKATLQAQLDAATTKAEKDPIRVQIDECNAKLEAARLDLEEADATLDQLRQARDEILFQERLSKDELLETDAPEVKRRKDAQEADCEHKRKWLAKHR
jgi:hypothetical protein